MPYLPEICRKDTGGGAEYENYIKKKPASSFDGKTGLQQAD
jgi:hypothetical protein